MHCYTLNSSILSGSACPVMHLHVPAAADLQGRLPLSKDVLAHPAATFLTVFVPIGRLTGGLEMESSPLLVAFPAKPFSIVIVVGLFT